MGRSSTDGKKHMFQQRMIDSGREMISAWLISDAKRIQSP
jgi:hypothetical protein